MATQNVLARIRKKIKTPSPPESGFANEVMPDEVIWAMGIEQEGTYVLNPLDTHKDWKTSFQKIYIPDYWKIHQWVNESEERKKTYPFLAKDDTIESSGRFCGKYVVYGDPIDSLLEISTRQAYGTRSMLPYVTSDILWYPHRIQSQQLQLIEEVNRLYKEYPLFLQKKKIYHSIIPYPYGMTDRQVPATSLFEGTKQTKYTNYTGSYHITITLPFIYHRITINEYREMYKRFINHIQWVEPLMLGLYSSCDIRGIGTGERLPRSSYRVMMTGWGNPAGSDIRKINDGYTRYAAVPLYWREGLSFPGLEKLERECGEDIKKKWKSFAEQHPEAISGYGTDIRTFWRSGLPGEIPKDGTPIDKLFGVEIRIFDYFPARYLVSLCRFIIYLAENGRKREVKKVVYEDPGWIGAMHSIMKHGWRAELPEEYITSLEDVIGHKLTPRPTKVADLWKVLLNVLHKHNKDGFYVKEMLKQNLNGEGEEADEQPKLVFHNVNRESWEFGFLFRLIDSDELVEQLREWLQSLPKKKSLSLEEVEKHLFKKLPKKLWKNDSLDIIYFFAHRNVLRIKENKKGQIKSILLSDLQRGQEILTNYMGEMIKLWPELLMYAEGSEEKS